MAHPEGEVATSKAAEAVGIPQVLSNWGNSTIEEVGEVAPTCLKMLQIYLLKSDEVN